MNGQRLRMWYRIHKWTGLLSTPFMLLLFITGLPLVFQEEIDHALGYAPEVPPLEESGQRADVDTILADARQRRPEEVVQFLVRDEHAPDVWFVRTGESLTDPDTASFLGYDARTGELLSDYPVGEGIMEILQHLHIDLFAGVKGSLFLGFTGLLFLVSLISGAVIYAPYLGRARCGEVRGPAPRLRWLDFHNGVGMITLVWVLVVGATGVIGTLSIPIFSHWQSSEIQAMTAGADEGSGEGSAEAAVAAAREAMPESAISFVAFPGTSFSSEGHYMAFMMGRTPLTSELLRPVMVDADTAEVTATPEMPWYVTTLLVSQPLHFGDYGGMPMKVLWAVLDLIAIAVLISGLYLWLKRGNGRASPRVGSGERA
ncbi:MAG: PepSY-associated TM helix domain-containing protein [Thiohalospira sp.]